MKNDWSFHDWFILVFIIVMVAGIISLFFSPPWPIEPGFLER